MSGTVWIGLCLLLGVLVLELLAPVKLAEGFQLLTTPAPKQKPNIITNLIVRRGDVGIDREQGGYVQDRRYFAGYADVQRFGVDNDFCRVVTNGGDPSTAVFACATIKFSSWSAVRKSSSSVTFPDSTLR